MKHLFVLYLLSIFISGCSTVPDKVWNPVCTDARPDISGFKLEEHFCKVKRDGWSAECVGQKKPGYETRVRVAYLEYPNETLAGKAPVRDACQLQVILDAVKNEKPEGVEEKPLLVSVYVHGWRHNASAGDENREAYPGMLARYSSALKRMEKDNFDVLGVYVGWRGKTGERTIDIDSRALAADEIGRASALKQELLAIAKAMQSSGSRMIVMGHSLGGRVLSRAFMDDLEQGNAQPLGKGVIITTINAAIGADAYRALYQSDNVSHIARVPTWVNFTAKEDGATRSNYKWGLGLDMLSPDFADGLADTKKTIGHYEPYLTHQFGAHYCGGDSRACGDISELKARVYTDYWRAEGYSLFTLNYKVPSWYCVLMASYPLSTELNERMAGDRKGVCKGVFEGDPDYDGSGYVRKIPVHGRLWNIRTDKSLLFSTERGWFGEWIFSTGTHNGYVQTNLANMLLQLVFDEDIGQKL